MGIEVIGEDKPLSWEGFLLEIEKHEPNSQHKEGIYRGQADADWKLRTTLERYLEENRIEYPDEFDLEEYYWQYLDPIIPQLNSELGCKFERIKDTTISETWFVLGFGDLPYYDLLCYARHLTFPTPLLDWTASYYVAAYFAFRDVKIGNNVAVWSYQYQNTSERYAKTDSPIIYELSPIVEAHTRHFRQQGTYTISGKFQAHKILPDKKVFAFRVHEHSIISNPSYQAIKKFIIDGNEKEKVLKQLYKMNINDYTLFGDAESLMKTLAFKSFRKL